MPLYLVGYELRPVQAGASYQALFPVGTEGAAAWSALKLGPGGPAAKALLLLPADEPVLAASKLAEDKDEPLVGRARSSVESELGIVTDSRAQTPRDLVISLLTDPPGRKWNAIQPARGRYEIWLGGERWLDQRVIAGGSDFTSLFTGSENPLSEGAVWESGGGDWADVQKVTGRAQATSVGPNCGARLITPSIGNDQYAQGTIFKAGAGDHGVGLNVRMQAGADESCYTYTAYSTTVSFISEFTAAFGETILVDFGASFGAGDVGKLTVIGSSLQGYKNDARTINVTDATIASGQPGFKIQTATILTDAELDDFTGGDGDRRWILGTH